MAESEMVERVARAIHEKAYGSSVMWRESVPAARAALEAMREPTNTMRNAGCAVGPDTLSGGFDYDDADRVWSAVISAALGQEGTEG